MTNDERKAAPQHENLCPSCRGSDNHPYTDDHGQNMRACGRCMIQWVVEPWRVAAAAQAQPQPDEVCGIEHSMPNIYQPCCLKKGHVPAYEHLFVYRCIPSAAQAQAPTPAIFPDCNIGTAHECCVARMKRLEKERYGINWKAEEGAPTPTPLVTAQRIGRIIHEEVKAILAEHGLKHNGGKKMETVIVNMVQLAIDEAAKSPAQPAGQAEPTRWIVISESRTSSQIARYHTEAAAQSFYDALDNYLGTDTCTNRTLCKVVKYESDSRYPVASETPQAPSEKEK